MYKVYFKHSKTKGFYTHTTVDWTLVDATTEDEAHRKAKQWVRENRGEGFKNRIMILETRKVGEA